MNILIIDDDSNWINLVSSVSSRHGITIDSVSNISKILNGLNYNKFTKIFIDFQKASKEIDNFSSLVNIQNRFLKQTIVTFTTELVPSSVSEMFFLGVDDCIDKSYDPEKIYLSLSQSFIKSYKYYLNEDINYPSEADVLIVDDDPQWRLKLKQYIEKSINLTLNIEIAKDLTQAKKLLEKSFDVIVLDLRLIDHIEDSNHFEGVKLLDQMRQLQMVTPIIIISAYGKVNNIRELFANYPIIDYQSKQEFNRTRYLESIKKTFSVCFANSDTVRT